MTLTVWSNPFSFPWKGREGVLCHIYIHTYIVWVTKKCYKLCDSALIMHLWRPLHVVQHDISSLEAIQRKNNSSGEYSPQFLAPNNSFTIYVWEVLVDRCKCRNRVPVQNGSSFWSELGSARISTFWDLSNWWWMGRLCRRAEKVAEVNHTDTTSLSYLDRDNRLIVCERSTGANQGAHTANEQLIPWSCAPQIALMYSVCDNGDVSRYVHVQSSWNGSIHIWHGRCTPWERWWTNICGSFPLHFQAKQKRPSILLRAWHMTVTLRE